MALARQEAGPVADVRALASQVHPVFMLPPVATSVFGGLLAPSFDLPVAGAHAAAIFLAVYTAHVKDGYVDFHGRGEDDDHPMTAGGCRVALAAATAGFLACTAALWVHAGPGTVVLTVPAWLIGYLHAPQLDTNPVGATMGYPVGVGLAVLGGHHAQAGALAATPVSVAAVFVVLLAGVKVIDDATDVAYDRTIEKRTVAVALGRPRARRLAYGLIGASLALVAGLSFAGPLPPGALAAAGAFGLVAATTRDADAALATKLLVRGAYVFLAVLVAVVWYRPFG